jgi:hypothetical protein
VLHEELDDEIGPESAVVERFRFSGFVLRHGCN